MEIPLLGKFNNPFPWLLGLMAAGILVVGATTYMILETPSTKENEINELTVRVKKQNLIVQIEASGKVEPVQSVNISPKNPGHLTELRVEQGDRVRQGQILAVMENAEIQAQGVEAQANVKQAIANLKEAQVKIPGEINQAQARFFQAQASLKEAQESIPTQIKQAEAQLRSAQARFKLAGDRFERNRYLEKEGAVARDQLDEAQNELRNAYESMSEAQQRLEEVKNTERPEIERLKAAVIEAQFALEQRKRSAEAEIAQLTAAVEAAQAKLEMVKVQFRDTIIIAPFDGIITQKYTTEGAFVTPTTSASSTASATSSSILALAKGLEVVAKVPEIDIAQLQPGQKVKIVADAYPDLVFQGLVKRVAPEAVVEENVTSFEVTIALLTGQDKLRSKMNVDVTFLGRQLSNALVVPTVAIVTQEGKTGVMVPDLDNKPQFQPVKIGLSLEDKTQILQGLNPGERVFIDLPEESRKKDK
ncbi:MAG: efflux RND transporter periplasmic adaptor subunit [Xenococcaceae cyanobacterium]